MAQSDTGFRGDASPMRRRLAHRLRPRHWLVAFAVLALHVRFLAFHPRLLDRLERGTLRPLMHLSLAELRVADRWNHRVSRAFASLGMPYARCMKRALVAALLLERRTGLALVIGVLPDDPLRGHAWLEIDGDVVADRYDARREPYVETRRLSIAPRTGAAHGVAAP